MRTNADMSLVCVQTLTLAFIYLFRAYYEVLYVEYPTQTNALEMDIATQGRCSQNAKNPTYAIFAVRLALLVRNCKRIFLTSVNKIQFSYSCNAIFLKA